MIASATSMPLLISRKPSKSPWMRYRNVPKISHPARMMYKKILNTVRKMVGFVSMFIS